MTLWRGAGSNVAVTWYPPPPYWNEPGNGAGGAAGVREPRRPIVPTNTGGAALDVPHHDESLDAA